ncbi:MAG: hypothetical protein ACI8WB_005049 [Phenylobacterium sp.]|jgi:hypothetical protein
MQLLSLALSGVSFGVTGLGSTLYLGPENQLFYRANIHFKSQQRPIGKLITWPNDFFLRFLLKFNSLKNNKFKSKN